MNAFGLLNPLAFALVAPLLGALIIAYLRKKKLPTVIVPSLFLLRDFTKARSTRKQFLPPARFWVELLVGLTLIVLAAGMFFAKEVPRYAILIDTSAAMIAGAADENLFKKAQDSVEESLRKLPSGTLVEVYRSSPTLERMNSNPMSVPEAIHSILQLKPTYAPGVLQESINGILQRGPYTGLIIISGKPTKPSGSEALDLTTFYAPSIRPRGVSNIALQEPILKSGLLHLSVSSYGEGFPESVTIEIEGTDGTTWNSIASEKLTLSKNDATLVHNVGGERYQGFKARIVDPKPGSIQNYISFDDTVYAAEGIATQKIHVFSLRSLKELGIEKIRGVQFVQHPLNALQEASQKFVHDSFLLVDFTPDGLPNRPTIVIAPPKSNAGFTVKEVVPSGEITSWFSGHSLLTYVDPATLTLKRFTPLGIPDWGEAILSTGRGAALAIGEQRGNRYVFAGFDLFPYQGRGTITQSVLFLNMLRWITAHKGVGAQSYRPYSAIEIASPQTAPTFVPEEGRPSSSEDLIIEDRYVMANHPGLIKLKGDSDIKPLIPVNFIDPRESSISSSAESITIEDRSLLTPKHTTSNQFELKQFLLPVLLALIALDWIGFPLFSSFTRRFFKKRSSINA